MAKFHGTEFYLYPKSVDKVALDAIWNNVSQDMNRAKSRFHRCERIAAVDVLDPRPPVDAVQGAKFYSCHPNFLIDAYDTMKGICAFEQAARNPLIRPSKFVDTDENEPWGDKNPDKSTREQFYPGEYLGFENKSPICNDDDIEHASKILKREMERKYGIVDSKAPEVRDILFALTVKEDRDIEKKDQDLLYKSKPEKQGAFAVDALYRFWYDDALPFSVRKVLEEAKLGEDRLNKEFHFKDYKKVEYRSPEKKLTEDDLKAVKKWKKDQLGPYRVPTGYKNAPKKMNVIGVTEGLRGGGTLKKEWSLTNMIPWNLLLLSMFNIIQMDNKDGIDRVRLEEGTFSDYGGAIDRQNGETSRRAISEDGMPVEISFSPVNRAARQMRSIKNAVIKALDEEEMLNGTMGLFPEHVMLDYSDNTGHVPDSGPIDVLAVILESVPNAIESMHYKQSKEWKDDTP